MFTFSVFHVYLQCIPCLPSVCFILTFRVCSCKQTLQQCTVNHPLSGHHNLSLTFLHSTGPTALVSHQNLTHVNQTNHVRSVHGETDPQTWKRNRSCVPPGPPQRRGNVTDPVCHLDLLKACYSDCSNNSSNPQHFVVLCCSVRGAGCQQRLCVVLPAITLFLIIKPLCTSL